MKEIRKEVITYESVDGNVFETKEDCLAWEKTYACIEKIPHKNVNGEILPNSNYDDNVMVLIPRNIEDINVINAYLNNIDSYNLNRLTQEDIGKTICINFGYDYDFYIIYKYPDILENIKRTMDNIETEIKEQIEEGK